VDALRRRARHARRPQEMTPTTAVAAEDEALREVVGDRVGEALRHLAPELRQVLEATVLDGLTAREAAVLLGIPEGTVKTRIRRARVAMRSALS
jgi:RNA polymerase sigma-70 factor (ECF subfamily)